MEKFDYYEITGFLPSSFVQIELMGKEHCVKFTNRRKAIDTLENVLDKWRKSDSYKGQGELVQECKHDGDLYDYRHQFVFKNSRTGLFYEITYKVVKHHIYFIK